MSRSVKRTTPMPLDPIELGDRVAQARVVPGGRSTWVGSPVTTMREFSPRRVRNIFICVGVVFCALVQDDEGIGQRAAAHEGERRDLDLAALEALAPSLPSGSMSCKAS